MHARILSPEMIVVAAIELLNEQGLDEVSLRKLAARLGVKAPSLARHVGDKARLQALMAEHVFRGCLVAVPPSDSWEGWLRGFGKALWDGQNRTRDAARLILVSHVPIPVARAFQAIVEQHLGAFGIAPARATAMQLSVQALITGWSGLIEGAQESFPDGYGSIEGLALQSLDALIVGWHDADHARLGKNAS